MANWPCQNPSCSSHGQPHPNCRCPAPLAEGGEAESYCASDRKHMADCEYYAEGGEIDPNKVVLDSAPSVEAIDPDKVKLDDSAIDPSQVQIDEPKEPGWQEHAKTGIEAAGRALTFGATDALQRGVRSVAEQYSDDPDFWAPKQADVKARSESTEAKAAEGVATAAGLISGAGAPGFISGLAKGAIPAVAKNSPMFIKAGAAAVRTAIEMGALQSGDEISNALLGKGDPEAPVTAALAHIAMSTALGFGAGGLFNVTGQAALKGLQAVEASRIGTTAKNMIAGMGIASKMHEMGIPIEDAADYVHHNFGLVGKEYEALEPGIKAYSKGLKNTATAVGGGLGGAIGSTVGGTTGTIIGERMGEKLFTPMVEKILNKAIPKANKYVYPAVLKALSEGNTDGIFQAIDYASKISNGARQITSGVDNLFKAGASKAVDMGAFDSDKEREKLNHAIESGGLNSQIQEDLNNQEHSQEMYAEGGKVSADESHHVDHIGTIFPEQAALLGAAKTRIYNYLNQARPQPPVNQLPFDKHVVTNEKQRSYNKALDIANAPLSILNKVKDGTITSEDMRHFVSMHPELHKHISQAILSRAANKHIDDEQRPSYRMKQSLSMFIGKPLEVTMTPSNIIAAQSTFQPKQSPGDQSNQPQGANKAKRGTAPLSKVSSSYMTKDQHREARQNKT